MDSIAKLLGIFITQPLWAFLLLVALTMWALLVMPLARVTGKRIEHRFEEGWTSGRITSLWPRVEAFGLMLHGGLGLIAALWCALMTDFPGPGISPDSVHPLGPLAKRIEGYFIPASVAVFAWVALSLRAEPTDNRGRPMVRFPYSDASWPKAFFAQLPRALFVGWLGALVIVSYRFFVDTSWTSIYSSAAVFSPAWLYCWVSLFSMSVALVLYLPIVALRWLWRVAARIP